MNRPGDGLFKFAFVLAILLPLMSVLEECTYEYRAEIQETVR